jgi:hypothetical protein
VALEKAFVERLVRAGRVVVHDTVCYGQRECGSGDHDQSCHWGTDAKYYCLRCRPLSSSSEQHAQSSAYPNYRRLQQS